MTTRKQLEAEAAEYVRGTDNGPDGYHGFIAGRTVTAEQVAAAAKALYEHGTVDLIGLPGDEFVCCVWEMFAAAGFIVEEGTDSD